MLKRQIQEMGGCKTQALTKICGKMLARRSQHVLREIDSHHASVRQCIEQIGSEPPAAAASVEHALVTAQFQTPENFLSPTYLRTRQPMVGRRIPLAGISLGVVAQEVVQSV